VNKTFLAAQISSKNFIYRHLAVLDSFSSDLRFEAEIGCKGKTSFSNFQIFLKLFFEKLFLKNFA
jgi:hypothetical protein